MSILKVLEYRNVKIEIPIEIPLIPVRDLVIFPKVIYPLTIGREQSLRALEKCRTSSHNGVLFFVTQKSDSTLITPDSLYSVGTVAVVQASRKVGEATELRIEGLVKAKIEGFSIVDPYFEVRISEVVEPQLELGSQEKLNSLIQEFEAKLKASTVFSYENEDQIELRELVQKYPATVPAHLALKYTRLGRQDLQLLLEATDPLTRMEMLMKKS